MSKLRVEIVTGAKNSGKTSNIIARIASNIRKIYGGFYSDKVFVSDELVGYDLVLLPSLERFPFLRLKPFEWEEKIGPFYINKIAIATVSKHVLSYYEHMNIIFLDEIGRLELQDKGFSALLTTLVSNYKGTLIMAVREDFLSAVCDKWDITPNKKCLV